MRPAAFVERRRLIVAGGLALGFVTIALNIFVPDDFAQDQLPWMFAIAPMFLVGAWLVLKVPGNVVGWLLFGIAVVGSFGTLQGFSAAGGWMAATGAALSTFAVTLLPLLLLVFPDGSLPGPRWRYPAAGTILTAVLGGLLGLMVGAWGGEPEQGVYLSPLYEATRTFTEAAINVFFPLFGASFVAALISLIVRYRHGTSDVKHQLKWLLAGVGFMVASLLLNFIQLGTQPTTGWQAIALAAGMMSFPLAIGVAVMRYRLYDIDVVISKGVAYGTLAVFIGAVYIAIVVGVGGLLGQGDDGSFALSIAATAFVAVAFQPMRRWVQRWANRLVYGERATPYEVLARFSRRAAEASDEELLARIPRMVVDGTGASEAVLWVRAGNGFRSASVWPAQPTERRISGDGGFTDPHADYSLPVFHNDELLGGLSLTKARGDSLTPPEQDLLGDLAAGLGLALRNARLTSKLRDQVAELEASRERILAASDAARRALENDLDSGPQQQLVALKVKLGPVRVQAERAAAPKTAKVLAELEEQAGEAIQAVRDFAAGIYPPLLEAEGLTAAITNQTNKAGFPISVSGDGVGRYSREVESAVYFTVLEALQNTAKYAEASSASVDLREQNGELLFEVRDDGRGFDPSKTAATAGAGLAGMADRLDTVGGELHIRSAPGEGTVVTGSAPIQQLVPA